MAPDAYATARPQRRRELDAMGMLVVLGLVFFHTAQIFYYGDFSVKNAPPSMEQVNQIVATVFVAFAGLWGMPLMFLIAGSAIWYSLRKRTVGDFVLERFKRLFIPFVTGLLVLVPPVVYYGLKNHDPTYRDSYVQFLPRYFDVRFTFDFPLFIKGAPPERFFQTGHLYFLIYLFAFTLLLLPLWHHLRRPAGRRLVERLAVFCTRPWALFLLALPIAAIEAALGTEYTGGWNRYAYVPFIVYGFLFAADGRFGGAFRRQWKSALLLGAFALLIYFAGAYVLGGVVQFDAQTDYSLGSVLFRLLKGITSWLWVMAIMGLAGRAGQTGVRHKRRGPESGREAPPQRLDLPGKPSFMDRLARYAGEAQLPFYVLHMTPMVVIGFYVVQWDVSAAVKYLVISLSSLVVTLALYDVGVRRTGLTRFLFGMRPKQKAPEGPASEGGVYAE